jgi:hypothetical protein
VNMSARANQTGDQDANIAGCFFLRRKMAGDIKYRQDSGCVRRLRE